MSLSRYDISQLIKEVLPKLQDYKIVVTTKTNVLRVSSTSDPTGTETIKEYTIKTKQE